MIHGTRDPLVRPSGGRATARAIPGARLRIFEGMGHDLPRALWPVFADEIADTASRAGFGPAPSSPPDRPKPSQLSPAFGDARKITTIGAWRSLVARGLWVAEVPGSNPGAPIFDCQWDRPSSSLVKLDDAPRLFVRILNPTSDCGRREDRPGVRRLNPLELYAVRLKSEVRKA